MQPFEPIGVEKISKQQRRKYQEQCHLQQENEQQQQLQRNIQQQLLDTNNYDKENFDDDITATVKCIFLCEFHVTAGRKITVQIPQNYLSKEKFETVSRYVIPQVELKRSFLSLSLLGIKILGYPIRIDHKQYARNAFYFNLCFVFSPTTRTIGFEPVVKKLSEYLLSMENSTRLLSQQNVQLDRISRILTQVRDDINSKKMCMLQEGSTLIPMCVVPRFLETVKIGPHHAAALTDEFYNYVRNQWDLTTLRILPYIDGFNHALRITALSDVALELVCDCIRHLVVLGVAVLVPVFQYGNVYRPTPKLSQLAKCRLLQQKCIRKCSKSARQNASVRDIFRIFASMAHGATFGELCVRFNPAALNINEKQMVLFGQLEGLIRRVEKFPVTVKRDLFAEDVDIIKKGKVSLVSGQIPNTPVFEQQLSMEQQQQQQQQQQHQYQQDNCDILKNCSNNDDDHNLINQQWKFHRHFKPSNLQRSNDYAQQKSPKLASSTTTTTTFINYNGLKSFDEICCTTGMSCQQLDYHLARDKHVIVLLK